MATDDEETKKAAQKTKDAENANLDKATPNPTESNSDAVSASNAAAAEAAGQITRAAAKAAGPEPAKNPDKTRPGDSTASEQTVPRVKASKNFDLVERFLDLSGYAKSDVIGHSDERRTVVTSNGGKYEVSVKGKKLRKLSGPDTPADLEAAEEGDED